MNIKVAIVEDDDRVRESLAQLIEGADGFACRGAYRTPDAAIKGITNDPPDVVLMDVQLPRFSGIECLQELRAIHPRLNVVMLTVNDDDDVILRAVQAGASGYLLKRTPPGEILKGIEEVHAGGSPMTGSIARKVLKALQESAAQTSGAEKLTSREKEILNLLAKGYRYKEIGEQLVINFHTVHAHIRNIYGKLQVRSRTEALNKLAAGLAD